MCFNTLSKNYQEADMKKEEVTMFQDEVDVGSICEKVPGQNDKFILPGATVKVLHRDSESCRVEDLSWPKRGDGIWWVGRSELKIKPGERYTDAKKLAESFNSKAVSPHYETAHQPIETMQANMTPEEFVGFLKGNIIKYACRCGRKDDPKKEAAKIKQYADWLVDALQDKTINPHS